MCVLNPSRPIHPIQLSLHVCTRGQHGAVDCNAVCGGHNCGRFAGGYGKDFAAAVSNMIFIAAAAVSIAVVVRLRL